MVLMFGLRVRSLKGNPLTPMMALTSPLVLPQSSSMLVTPLVVMCTLPDNSASLLAPPLMIVTHATLRSGIPARLACFSTSLCCSIKSIGVKSNPGCLVILISLSSARAAPLVSAKAAMMRALGQDLANMDHLLLAFPGARLKSLLATWGKHKQQAVSPAARGRRLEAAAGHSVGPCFTSPRPASNQASPRSPGP